LKSLSLFFIKLFSLVVLTQSSPVFAQVECTRIDSLKAILPSQTSEAKVKTHNWLAWCLSKQGADSALFHAEEAIRISSQIGDEDLLFTSYLRKGVVFYRRGDYDNANHNYLQAKEIANRINDTRAKGRVATNLGSLALERGDYLNAKRSYLLAFQSLVEKDQIRNRAITAMNLSMAYRNLRVLDSAFHFANYSLKKLDSLQLNEDQGKIREELGRLWVRRGDLSKAKDFFLNAIHYYQQGNANLSLANGYMELGNLYYRMKNWDSALHYDLLALNLKQVLNTTSNIVELTNNLALLYEVKLKPDSARHFYNLGEQLAKANSDSLGLALIYFNKAVKASDEEAVVLYQNAFSIYERLGSESFLLQKTANLLGNKLRKLNQYEKAFPYDEEARRLEDQAQKSEFRLIELEKDNEIQRTENQLQKAQLNQLRLEQKNTYTTAISAFIVVVLSGLWLLRYRVNQVQLAARDERIEALLQKQELSALSAMVEGQESERKRIAQDLHDRLGSMLAMVKLHFTTVNKSLAELQDQARERYEEANALLDQACDEVRKVAHDMVSGVLVDFGLVAALKKMAESITKSGELRVDVMAYGMTERIDRPFEITLYRIVQELTGNVLKHAKANELTVQLIKKDNNLNITVEDDGTGFELSSLRGKEGMGLRNLEERVKSLNGDFSIDSSPGNGTHINMNIPL